MIRGVEVDVFAVLHNLLVYEIGAEVAAAVTVSVAIDDAEVVAELMVLAGDYGYVVGYGYVDYGQLAVVASQLWLKRRE